MLNTYLIYNQALDADAFLLYDTVEDTPSGPQIDSYLTAAAERLLKRNGGTVEIRDRGGRVLSRYTRNQPY